MSLYTERWIARPAWLALPISERIAYLDQMEAGMRALADAGAILIGLVLDEAQPPVHSSDRYLAVWVMPEEAQVRMLESMLKEAGWHRYFRRADETSEPERTRASLFPSTPPSHWHGNGRLNGRRE